MYLEMAGSNARRPATSRSDALQIVNDTHRPCITSSVRNVTDCGGFAHRKTITAVSRRVCSVHADKHISYAVTKADPTGLL
jgi:hypothetical protein